MQSTTSRALPSRTSIAGFAQGHGARELATTVPSTRPSSAQTYGLVTAPTHKSKIPKLESNFEPKLCTQFEQLWITRQQGPFPESLLGSLPPELRQMIYGFALSPPQKATSDGGSQLIKRKQGSKQFSFLGASRQIYFETRPIFFSAWTFYLEDARHLYEFLIIIGRAREYLREIHLAPLLVAGPDWGREKTEARLAGLGLLDKYSKEVNALRRPELDPMMLNARPLLSLCKSLKRIHFDVYKGSQYLYERIFGSRIYLRFNNMRLIFQSECQWCIIDEPYVRGENFRSRPSYEHYGFNMRKWVQKDQIRLRKLVVDIKSASKEIFRGSWGEALKDILDAEIMNAANERGRVFPNLEETVEARL